jgi:uncharacterized protein YndB with AHSA1/START domain
MDYVAHAEALVEVGPDQVWQSLTSREPRPEIMFGARTTTDWVPGRPIIWAGEWHGRTFEDKGELLEVEPPHRLVVTHFSPMSGQQDVPDDYHRLVYGSRRSRVVLEWFSSRTTTTPRSRLNTAPTTGARCSMGSSGWPKAQSAEAPSDRVAGT